MREKLHLRWLSPTAIVGIIALVIALGGTAVAGGVLTTKKFKNQSLRGPVQYVVTLAQVNPPATTPVKLAAACPTGTKPTGGGVKISIPSNNDYMADGYITATGYGGTAFNGAGPAVTATTVAICVTVKSSLGTPPAS